MIREKLSLWAFISGPVLVASSLAGQTGEATSTAAWVGTWNLDVAESRFDPGPPPKSKMIKIEPHEGGYRSTMDGVDAQNQRVHTETVATFDGEEALVRGARVHTSCAYTGVDDHTFTVVTRVKGKVMTRSRSVVSRDGKTRTVTQTGTNEQGLDVYNVEVYVRR